jgi:phosphopantetheinyl transferase
MARRPIKGWESLLAVLAEPERVRGLALESPKRKGEWAAGRAAAREALQALVGPLPAHVFIGQAADGAPEVRGLDHQPPPAISISHGHREAVALAARTGRVGIDLCDHQDAHRVRRLAARFLAAEECALARTTDDDASWSTLWALKEAAAKALRVGLLDGGLRATRVASLDPPRFAPCATQVGVWQAFVLRGADEVIAGAWSPHG